MVVGMGGRGVLGGGRVVVVEGGVRWGGVSRGRLTRLLWRVGVAVWPWMMAELCVGGW